MKKTIITVIIIILIITIGVMGLLLWQTNKKQTQNSEVNPIAIDTINNTGLDNAKPKVVDNSNNLNDDTVQTTTQKNANNDQNKNNFKKFIDKDFGISFEYPENFNIQKSEGKFSRTDNVLIQVSLLSISSPEGDIVKDPNNAGQSIVIYKAKQDFRTENERTARNGASIILVDKIKCQEYKVDKDEESFICVVGNSNTYYKFDVDFTKSNKRTSVFENIIKSVKFLK